MKIWNNIYFSIIKGKISGNIDDSEVNLVILQSHKIHLVASMWCIAGYIGTE